MSTYYLTEWDQRIEDFEVDGLYAETLDEIYPVVNVAGMEYSTSTVLREVDPIAFRCGVLDWVDSNLSDGIWTEHED